MVSTYCLISVFRKVDQINIRDGRGDIDAILTLKLSPHASELSFIAVRRLDVIHMSIWMSFKTTQDSDSPAPSHRMFPKITPVSVDETYMKLENT